MKIISWNVNGLRAVVKKDKWNWWLKEKPDIFCIQETKAHPDQLSEEIRKPDGYVSYFDHSKARKGYSGVAIYIKSELQKNIKAITYGIGITEMDQEGRLIGIDFGDFVLFNVYFPNGGGGPVRLKYKLEFYDYFLKHIEKLRKSGKEIIFCGDINTAHTEIDLARPKENEENTGFLPIERAWIDKVVKHGYVDIWRELHRETKKAYTYWDMKTFARDRNVGWRIDYFFVSQPLVSRVTKAELMDNIFGSDHCPIVLELKYN